TVTCFGTRITLCTVFRLWVFVNLFLVIVTLMDLKYLVILSVGLAADGTFNPTVVIRFGLRDFLVPFLIVTTMLCVPGLKTTPCFGCFLSCLNFLMSVFGIVGLTTIFVTSGRLTIILMSHGFNVVVILRLVVERRVTVGRVVLTFFVVGGRGTC